MKPWPHCSVQIGPRQSHGLLSIKVSLCNMSHKEEFFVETAAVVYIILIVG